MMKRYLIVLLLMCGISIQAQDIIQCRKIVQEAINAIDVKSSKNLEPFLDDDFSIFEQTGDKAKMVLQQFMVKINDVVAEYHEIQTEPSSGYLTLKYIFTYKNRGSKESTFVFSPQNKLVKISLFEIKPLTEAYADQIFQSNEDTIRIPFTLNTGNLIIVDAMLNGQVRKFFFDSGSPKLILNSEYIDQDDVNEENSMLKARGVNTNIRNISLVKDQNFNWAGIQLDSQTLMATNLSTLEKGCKDEIYGIIGYEIFRNYDIHFDYQKKVLTLIRAGYLDQYALKHKFSGRKHTVIPFKLTTHIPVVKAVVNNRELNMGIDCGA
ncbi:MAG: aspartyl protease family protein, partial [Bacteroidota bacterium]|nr:aspartyl protease family protein [Bacteroidota bacterium]